MSTKPRTLSPVCAAASASAALLAALTLAACGPRQGSDSATLASTATPARAVPAAPALPPDTLAEAAPPARPVDRSKIGSIRSIALTGVGAVGGAIAGNNIERNQREAVVGYNVWVRLDDGQTRTFARADVNGLQVGDRVRLASNPFRRE